MKIPRTKNDRSDSDGALEMTPGHSNPTGTVQSFDGRANLGTQFANVSEGQWGDPAAFQTNVTRDLEAKVLNASRVRNAANRNDDD